MPIEILVPRSKEQWHNHKCPACKQVKREPNTVCGFTAGDHVYRCLGCLSGFWRRFGDTFMDAYLDEDEFSRLKAIAPDQLSEALDVRDEWLAQWREAQEKKIVDSTGAPVEREKIELSPEEQARRAKEQHDELIDTADRITEEEVLAEIKKIEEDEKI